MSDIIHLLPDHIANQIAAGEVIQRPASVVKELMENAIDARATQIIVNIKDAGRSLIQVIDNGKGMSETDARMAFERHATSKIETVDDLFTLKTMGFRGEALASIAAVSQVELCTRSQESDEGIRLLISGSALESTTPEACNEGSVFSVKNLFYNVPARRKFLKSNETEFRHILAEFERASLVHPEKSFILRHNDTTVFELPESGLRQRIADVFGKKMNQKLLSVETDTSLVNIRGFIGTLSSVKKRNNLQYFFANGRYMRHPYFNKAIMQAYEKMVPIGERPDFFIYFTLDPSSIDVNIHPTKTEIKFENERAIWQILYSVVRETLAKSNAVPSIEFDTAEKINIPVYDPSKKDDLDLRSPKVHVDKSYNPFQEMEKKKPMDDWKALYEGFEKDKTEWTLPSKSKKQEEKQTTDHLTPETPLFISQTNPCFQYKNRYIITPLKSGLVIIDQNKAHIRILYEKYIGNINNRRSASQKLLFPEMLELTATEESALPSLSETLKFLGFDLVHLGGNSYAIHAVPADIPGNNPEALVKDVIAATIETGVCTNEKRAETMALSLAKATAIPVGKPLTIEEMENLVASLFAIESNGMTPEGDTVLTILTDEELQKRM